MSGIIAITGSRGLIGKYITESLLAKGYCVRVLSRQTKISLSSPMLTKVTGSLCDLGVINKLLDGVEAVYHCAAELHEDSKMYDVNVKGTAHILEAIQRIKTVKYFCYLSSAGVVGPTGQALVDEEFICKPNNEYERTKREAELLVLNTQLHGVNTCVLRPGNVFDGQKLGLLSLVQQQSLKNKLALFIKGNEGAHLVHAQDVADAALFFMDKMLVKPEVFFVSYDSDARNTVLGVCKLYFSINKLGNQCLSFALPCQFIYMIRKLLKGHSLHGRTRFSEEKLNQTGFIFPLGLEGALKNVCVSDKGVST